MSAPIRRTLGLVLIATGAVVLGCPIRRHRAVWLVTVDDQPTETRNVYGRDYAPATQVMLATLRSGDRRPDAEIRIAVGLALIGTGLALSATSTGS